MASHLMKSLTSSPDITLVAILLNEGRLAQVLRTAGLEVYVIDEKRNSFLQIAKAIRKRLVANPPHIIHSHRYKENLLAFLASRTLPGTRLITTQHGLPETHAKGYSQSGNFTSRANFFILKRYFKKVVAVSRDIGTFFVRDLGFSTSQVDVVHNGIDIPAIISRKTIGEPFFVGSSGRLFSVKGYPLMVDLAKIMAEKSNVRFTIAGDGPERGTLEAAIMQNALAGRFHLMGHIDEMDAYYQGLDLYLNTSLHEGIPMTILEAMAQGLPVVAPRVGGIPEIIEDGVEGFLIDGRDPRAYAEKCLSLAGDNKLWCRMSLAARKRAMESFSVERMTEQYLQVYRDAVALTTN